MAAVDRRRRRTQPRGSLGRLAVSVAACLAASAACSYCRAFVAGGGAARGLRGRGDVLLTRAAAAAKKPAPEPAAPAPSPPPPAAPVAAAAPAPAPAPPKPPAPSPPPAPAPSSSSYALVTITEESKITTATLLAGLAGLLVGGVWVGGALFAVTAYITRVEDSDLSKALKGVAAGGLEVLNFGAYLNDKFMVADKVGSSLTEVAAAAKSTSGNKETLEQAEGLLKNVGEAITTLDKDIGIKDTLGTFALSASDLAAKAVSKAVEVNNQYKIADKIKDTIQEAVEKTSAEASPSKSKAP